MVFKTPGEVDLMHEANRIVHEVLDLMAATVAPGVTTKVLDAMGEDHIRSSGGVPAFLNYRGFPATLCTSINDVIVHGIPNEEPLEEGDIVLLNNYAVAHSRSAFEDWDEEDRKRHLLRLWLVLYDGRPLATDFDNRAGLETTADIREDGLAPA